MENRVMAALVSSLVSQALLLLFSFPTTTTTGGASPLFLLQLLAFSSSSQIAAAAAAAASTTSLLPRKRKRPRTPDPDELESESEDLGRGGGAVAAAVAPISIRRQPDYFRLGFGMAASTFEWLSGLLEPLLDCRDPSSSCRLTAAARLAIGLSRLATGAAYPDLSRRFGVPEPAARFCVRRLCRVLCTNFRFWLAFPSSPSDLRPVSAAFESLGGRGLPGCCGAVACARFEIRAGEDGVAVAAQVVADASCRILNIATGFRGDQVDSRVLRRSSLYRDGEAGRLLSSPDHYLVGGGSYPLRPWLMVPFAEPAPGSHEDFNAVHHSMLQPAIRTVVSLRNWGVLSRPMEGEEDVKAAVACIATCAILHNVLLMREDYSALAEVTEDFPEDGERAWCCCWEENASEESPADEKATILREALAERAGGARHSGQLEPR